MIKLLIFPDILLQAISQKDSPALKLLERCKNDFYIQAWTMADSIQVLANQGESPQEIDSILEGISQIPVNASLNKEAVQSSYGYSIGLALAATKMFKISYLVSENITEKPLEAEILNCQQVLDLDSDEISGQVDFLNLSLALHPIFDRVDGWFMEIIQNTAFAGGDHVNQFEQEFAEFCGVKHIIGVANGTDALLFALLAMGIGAGDEVITVPNTFIATTEAILQAGAKPVFVDVLPDSYNINPDLIEEKITQKTKAIIPVHLYGQVADMDRILTIAKTHDLKVLEDSCQAHGAIYKGKRAGSLGDAAAFSMYPGKNMGAYGEAGCVATNDDKVADTIRCLKDHGQYKKYYHRMDGYNGRMDNLQAAALRGKIPFLDMWNEKRRQLAKLYAEQLMDVPEVTLPVVSDYSAHVFHIFVILVKEAQKLVDYLKQKEIYTAFHYPIPLHLQETYSAWGEGKGSYPVSERCAEQLISLPMFPELNGARVKRVCHEIKAFFDQC